MSVFTDALTSFDLADGKVAWTWSGAGAPYGSPVLMIQGLGLDHRGWALQRGAFGRRHRCIAPDNRGTGHSDAPPGRSRTVGQAPSRLLSNSTHRAIDEP